MNILFLLLVAFGGLLAQDARSQAPASFAAAPAPSALAPVSFSPVASKPASLSAIAAFKSFGNWLDTPEGLQAMQSYPFMGRLRDLQSRSKEAQAIAWGPLSDGMFPELKRKIGAIGRADAVERVEILGRLSSAWDRTVSSVRQDVRSSVLAAQYDESLGSEQLKHLAQQLRALSIYDSQDQWIWRQYKALRRASVEAALQETGARARRDWKPRNAGKFEVFARSSHWTPEIIPDARYRKLLASGERLLRSIPPDNALAGRLSEAQQALSLAPVQEKNQELFSHMSRLRYMSALIGFEMGFPIGYVRRFAWAGWGHDIGKIAHPVLLAIANYVGKLSPVQRFIMSCHTDLGAGMFREDTLLDPASRRVGVRSARDHHDVFNERGWETSLEGRIVQLPDRFDALLDETRRYRQGEEKSIEAALRILEGSREQFDPRVWAAFSRLVRRALENEDSARDFRRPAYQPISLPAAVFAPGRMTGPPFSIQPRKPSAIE